MPYSLEVKTSDPNTVCTAYRGNVGVPLPTLLKKVFYAPCYPARRRHGLLPSSTGSFRGLPELSTPSDWR